MVVNLEHLLDGFGNDEAASDSLVTDKYNTIAEL